MAHERKPLMSGNWKMNLNHFEAIQLVQKLSYILDKDDLEAVDVSIHPPFTDIRSVQTVMDADRIGFALGAQNCHWEASGAYTGEVSAPMLAKLAVSYIICGHSERRHVFGETNDEVNKKVKAVIGADMVPILAVGETLEQREAAMTDATVVGQVLAGLDGVKADVVAEMVVAYEPVWAIGTGQTASPEDAQTVCGLIRGTIGDKFGADAAERVRIQYGGSVKPVNAAELMGQKDIDGALVGGASLVAEDFARICQYRLY